MEQMSDFICRCDALAQCAHVATNLSCPLIVSLNAEGERVWQKVRHSCEGARWSFPRHQAFDEDFVKASLPPHPLQGLSAPLPPTLPVRRSYFLLALAAGDSAIWSLKGDWGELSREAEAV